MSRDEFLSSEPSLWAIVLLFVTHCRSVWTLALGEHHFVQQRSLSKYSRTFEVCWCVSCLGFFEIVVYGE